MSLQIGASRDGVCPLKPRGYPRHQAMADEITFQNDPVADEAESLDPDQARRNLQLARALPRLAEPAQHTGELDWDGAREWRP